MADPLWNLDAVHLGGRVVDVTLRIHPGVTAIIGHSGAGKTSLVHLLVGMEKPDRGSLTTGCRPFWVPQNGGLWPHVTVRGHLEMAGPGDAMGLLEEFDLSHRAGAKPGQLSQGERSRLSLARALMARADVLVMDEPLVDVDPARVGRYWQILRNRLAATGTSLVFATHLPEDVLGEAGTAICLKHGSLLYSGDVGTLYHRPATEELAECLGATNWFDRESAERWLGDGADAGSYRPERIEVTPSGHGAFTVTATRFRGTVAELIVRDEAGSERTILHRPTDAGPVVGGRVDLQVRDRVGEGVA